MKKTMFRTSLLEGSNTCCDKAVLTAAYINGGKDLLDLADIKRIAELEKDDHPDINQNTSIELIGDTLLHIDTKIGDEYKTVCVIEQVEIFELEEAVTE